MTANTNSYRHLDGASVELCLCRPISLPEKAKEGQEIECDADADAACSGYDRPVCLRRSVVADGQQLDSVVSLKTE